jgi:predicted RNase H-like HicB family nuclease
MGDTVTAMTNQPTLRYLLSVPYRIEAFTAETGAGVWVRRAAYPELPDCMAEAATIEETLARLEHRRLQVLVDLMQAGTTPPMPRPALRDYDADGLLHRHGVHGALSHLLDLSPLQWPTLQLSPLQSCS